MVDDPSEELVQWPELVGTTAAEAEAHIRQSHPEVTSIQTVPPGYDIPADWLPDRVWLHVDENGVVRSVPHIG